MDAQTRCKLLDETAWANDFSWREMQTLAQYLEFASTPKSAPIIREGDTSAFLCILVKGRAQVVKENLSSHEENTLAVIHAGDSLGEMSLFDGEPRSAAVIALEDTEMLTLSSQNLNRLIQDKPALAAKLLLKLGKIISRRLRMASGKLCELQAR
jgi:CRP-like cAMP-binding protein